MCKYGRDLWMEGGEGTQLARDELPALRGLQFRRPGRSEQHVAVACYELRSTPRFAVRFANKPCWRCELDVFNDASGGHPLTGG